MKRHLVSAADLSPSEITALFARADELSNGAPTKLTRQRIALALENPARAAPVDIATTLRDAGAEVIVLAPRGAPAAQAAQINVANADLVIVNRSEMATAAEIKFLTPTYLNAGDGAKENPVRGLIEAYAIHSAKPFHTHLRVALLGNLKFSAEAHSLARILGQFEMRLSFVSPAALSMPYDLTDQVRLMAYEVEETNDLAATLRKTDVLCLFNLDERVEQKTYDKLKNFYSLTPDTIADAKPGLLVLGEWDSADGLLAPARPLIERAARAMLLALVELYEPIGG